MSPRQTATDEWRDALCAALSSAPPVQLFLERREDSRLEFRSDVGWAATRTRSRGLAASDLTDRRRHVYLAAPGPPDAAPLVRIAASGDFPRSSGDSRESGRDDEPSIDPLEPLAREAVELVAGVAGRILPSAVFSGRAIVSRQSVHVARPGRDCVTDVRTAMRIRVAARLARGPLAASAVVETALHRRAKSFKSEALRELGVQLARRVERRLESRVLPAGHHAVVLGPGVGGVLIHEVVGHAAEADAGRSWLARAEGPVAPRPLVVVDDPRVGRAAWRFDDEAVASRATPLIRDGRPAGKLHDRHTARRDGTEPSGHGRRSSYREPVLARMGCTFVGAGPLDPAEVVRETHTGVYVHRMEAGHVDVETSHAVFRVTDADRIVAGRLGGPLDPFVMFVVGRDVVSGLTRVAHDLTFDSCIGSCHREGQPLAISVGAPTICIGVVGVAS